MSHVYPLVLIGMLLIFPVSGMYIRGYVMDYSTTQVQGAIVSLAGYGHADTTDENGWFYMDVNVDLIKTRPRIDEQRLTTNKRQRGERSYILDLRGRVVSRPPELRGYTILSNGGKPTFEAPFAKGIYFLQSSEVKEIRKN